jgi:hypothetical protein
MYHRTEYYTVPDNHHVRCSWWQVGSRIFRYREF